MLGGQSSGTRKEQGYLPTLIDRSEHESGTVAPQALQAKLAVALHAWLQKDATNTHTHTHGKLLTRHTPVALLSPKICLLPLRGSGEFEEESRGVDDPAQGGEKHIARARLTLIRPALQSSK
eukprot:5570371-Amphidinium_carterae.1